MRREDIRADVIETARRFGDRNPQEFQRLTRLAARTDPKESVQGLLSVFSQPSMVESTATEQELAGKLLAALPAIPPSDLPLQAFLRSTLQNYDRSVEQLPRYSRWCMVSKWYRMNWPGCLSRRCQSVSESLPRQWLGGCEADVNKNARCRPEPVSHDSQLTGRRTEWLRFRRAGPTIG